ncbi:MAG TPA: hypothetical protein VHG93_22175 [Longimicrobium sp.]|nr:hypothetical protein [Longimicrobium sp.]
MRLDLSGLQVETFETAAAGDVAEPIWTDKGGPESYCYVCYPTGNTDPACQPKDTIYYPCPLPDTYFYPCTQDHQQTCVGCA